MVVSYGSDNPASQQHEPHGQTHGQPADDGAAHGAMAHGDIGHAASAHDAPPASASAPGPIEDSSEVSASTNEHAADEPAAVEPAAIESESPATVPPPPKEPKSAPRAPANGTPLSEPEEAIVKEWYILKVQSNREESIREGLLRRVKMAGLERFFGDCIVPTEMVSEFKGGKKRVSKRKLYPGYLVVHMAINDDTWYLVRETAGIGDFTGSIGRPSPMAAQDVQKIIAKSEEKTEDAPKLKIKFKKGDRVKINEGTFENFEGDVDAIDDANGRVIVMINIFGRSTPVELEYWQIESI